MCGIVGIINKNSNNHLIIDEISKLNKSLYHRGPDSDGYYMQGNLAFGHRRLAIIDLNTGDQPIISANKNFIIIFNGEIYNYKEIRDELISNGIRFNTESDTEVIVNAYQEWGPNCFNKFNGEWALAIWNKMDEELILSRDRYGIKPLYYCKDVDKFIFASEIKTLLIDNRYEIDKNELWDLLVFGPKDGGKTIYNGISELLPGTYLTVKNNNLEVKKYYSLVESFNNPKNIYDIDEIEFLVSDSIEKRLISDVPIGTINSGGLDSSFVSSLAQKQCLGKLKTFSVAPETLNGEMLDGDESIFAERLANSIQSEHRTIRYSQKCFIDDLEEAIYYNDEVLYHSNSIPLSYMFKLIKHKYHTTVILGGEGADEVFRGYSINKYSNFYQLFEFSDYLLKKIETYFYYKLPTLKIIERYFPDVSFVMKLSIFHNSHLRPEVADALLNIKGAPSVDRSRIIFSAKDLDSENQLIYYEQKCFLQGLLHRVDRMSMRWAVEARIPFLDHRLVNYMNSIHPHLKSGITNKSIKMILKRIAKKHVDKTIIKRKKYGFASPLNVYKNDFINFLSHSKIFKHLKFETLSDQEVFILIYYLLSLKTQNNDSI